MVAIALALGATLCTSNVISPFGFFWLVLCFILWPVMVVFGFSIVEDFENEQRRKVFENA